MSLAATLVTAAATTPKSTISLNAGAIGYGLAPSPRHRIG